MTQRLPLILFALDSADLELIDRWTKTGYLPNIQSLIAEGQLMKMGAPGAFDETGSWLTAYSGVAQNEHGYYCSRCVKSGSYDLQYIQFEDAGVSPFWALDQANNLKSAILDLPEPIITKSLNGIQLNMLNAHQETYVQRPTQSEPAELADAVINAMGNYSVEYFDNYKKRPRYFRKIKDQGIEMLRKRGTILRNLLAQDSFDVIALGFGETHDLAHFLWPTNEKVGYQRPEQSDPLRDVKDVYMEVDKEIGEFVKSLPEDANIMVVSTYGIKEQFPTAALVETLIDRLQYRVRANAPNHGGNRLNKIKSLVPEPVRHYLSHYLPRGIQQYLVRQNFLNDCDFSKSRIYTIPSYYQNWIRVNLEGRDPQGIVPIEAYSTLLDELEQTLWEITDPLTGEPAISTVLRPNDSARVNKLESDAPDLVVHWKSSKHFLEKAQHPSGELKQRRPHFLRSTFHGFPGFVIWKGPGAQAGYQGDCAILDFAPTCLDLLGVSSPPDLKGRSFARGGY